MPVPYDFKRASRETPRRSTGAKRLRFFAVLCVVAAVTAGVIMLIVPGKSEKSEAAGAGKGNASGSNVSGSGNSLPTAVPGGGSGNSGSGIESGSGENSSGNSSFKGDPGEISGGGTDAKNESASGSTGYKKGVIQPGDLSPGADKPEFRAGQAPGADGVLAAIRSSQSADEVVSQAREFLMREYSAGGEFSTNWSSVGAELAGALRTKWQKLDWKKEAVIHKVVARDHLIKIARRNNATVEGIKFINKRKNNFLRIGEKLSVVPGPWRITVSRKARLLNLWRKEKNAWNIFAVFPVGVGRKNSTPAGEFRITHRLRHPKWYGPDGRVLAYGDKENPLGDYFLKLIASDPHGAKKNKGYGIHGSVDDSTVGRSLSNGCLRMHNQDVEILYYLVPGGCPVKIVD